MLRLHITHKARRDLLEIWNRIGGDNPYAADRVVNSIRDRLHKLTSHPYTGQQREDIGAGVRRVVIGQYLVFYQVTDQMIWIIRVIQGKRRISARLIASQ